MPAALEPESQTQLLSTIVRHMGGWAAIIDSDLKVFATSGELSSQEQEPARITDILAFALRLGDQTLQSDLQAGFANKQSKTSDFISRRGSHCLRRIISNVGNSSRHFLLAYQDISKDSLQRFIAESQHAVMGALIRHDSPDAIFTGLTSLIERYSAPGTHASVLWLSPDGKHLRHIASPTLPKSYTDAIDGIEIGPKAGSCGTAAYSAKRIIVEDIGTDPLWEDYRGLALSSGLRACWSQPVISPDGSVLGTLALYREEIIAPSAPELALLDTAVQLASIAICNLHRDGQISFQGALLDSVRDAVVAINQHGVIRYWGSGATELFGYQIEASQHRHLDSVIDIAVGIRQAHERGLWSGEERIELEDGKNLTVEVSISAILHYQDRDRGFVIIFRDVSDRRAAEELTVTQSRQNRAVAYLGRLALGDIDQQALLDFAVESLVKVLDIAFCTVFELERENDLLKLRAASGLHENNHGDIRVACDSTSQIGFTLMSSTPVVIEDLKSDTRFDGPEFLHQQGVVSGISVIIHGLDNRPYGILGVYTTRLRRFGESDVSFMQSVANVLSESIRREHSDKSLQHSEQRFRDLADSMPQIVWSANAEGQIDYFNDRWNKLVGSRGMACDTDTWLGALHPNDRQKWVEGWATCVRDRSPFEIEVRIEQTSGYRWYLTRALPSPNLGWGRGRWYGSCTDIDDHKAIEHRLREQAHELVMVNWINSQLAAELDLENLVQVVIDVGTQLSGARFGAYYHCADDSVEQVCELYALAGISREEFNQSDIPRVTASLRSDLKRNGVLRSDDILSDTRYDGSAPHFGLPSGHSPVRSYMSVPVVSRSGAIIGGMFFGHPDVGVFDANDERLMAGLATQAAIAVDNVQVYEDLMESKNEVRGQYEQLKAIYASAPVGLCYVDSRLRVLSINDHLRNLVGYVSDDFRDKRLGEVMGRAAIALDPICNEVMTSKMPVLNREIEWLRHTAEDNCYWLCNSYPILAPDGNIVGINTVIQDITERKLSELDHARLASIISNSYDAIIGKTLDGRVTSWNQGAERMFGYKSEEVIGQSITMIIPDHLIQEEHEILKALRQGRHVTFEETQRIRKDGVTIHVAVTISPIRKGKDKIVGVSTIVRDLTASKIVEKKARENEDRMRLVLQATHIGIWDWHIGSGLVRWSDNMEELHGRQPGSFDGTLESVTSDVYSDDRILLQKAINKALESKGDYQVEYRIRKRTGQICWMEGKGQVLYDDAGKPERLAGVCMDITVRKEAEQTLRVNETLLRTQTEELAREHRQKDEFLAMLAHELRNPLAPISNMVQLMKIQGPGQREKTLPQALDVIGRQVTQMSRLVDDLLDVARITRGYIELKSADEDLRTIVQQAAESSAGWFDAKHQDFELFQPEIPVYVSVDAARMIQVVSNLLNNASKYTGDSGRISLTLSSIGQEAVISVVDSGVGISADILPHVFDLFTQADRSLDRRQGGLGLGLPLVRKLVNMHRGTVVAKSPGMGRGSEFIVRLPLVDIAETTERTLSVASELPKKGRVARIMVVDDNIQSADAMAMLLETLGHRVKVSYSGPDALCTADQFGPELVFLDIGLPLMDGYEVAAKLRARFGGNIRLIALTGYSQQPTKRGGSEIDFDDYILKPLSLDHLISLLDNRSSQHINEPPKHIH